MSSKPVTETIVLHLQQGVALEEVFAGRGAGSGTPAHDLTVLGDTIKAQPGCIRQFWGKQVENPNIFVWTIDWESFEHHAAFINSDGYKGFMARVTQVFDLEVAAPLMTHTAFTSDATASREAPVTELALFMIPKESDEETKSKVEDLTLPVLETGTKAGTCSAFALGWIFEDQAHPQAPNGTTVALHALLGWPSVEKHQELRASPEFATVIRPLRAAVLPPLQGRSMFHVKFHPWV